MVSAFDLNEVEKNNLKKASATTTTF